MPTTGGFKSLAIAAAALLGVPAGASAATLAASKLCYLEGESAMLAGEGYTPGAPVTFAFDGVAAAQPTADGTGNVFAGFRAPDLGSTPVRRYTVTATDQSNPANVGTTDVAVTKRLVSVSPSTGSPRRRVRFKARGFVPRRTLYAHYVLRGRERARTRLGRATGACGTLTKRARFFPQRQVDRGYWTIQFDQLRRFSRSTRPAYRARVRVYRR